MKVLDLYTINFEKILVFSSLLVSGLNFFIYVLLPSVVGVEGLSEFARNNYLGGLYLFSVGSSVSVISVQVLTKYGYLALKWYLVISFIVFSSILILLIRYLTSVEVFACLISAIFLHINGFLLSNIVLNKSRIAVFVVQLSQPMLFLTIMLASEVIHTSSSWTYSYVISSFISLLIFCYFVDLATLISRVKLSNEQFKLYEFLITIASAVSFSLFFQFELMLVGEVTDIELGEYVVLQKLYSSISISVFGALLIHFYRNAIKQGLMIFRVLKLSFVPIVILLIVILFLNLYSSYHISTSVYILLMNLSYIFSVTLFVNYYLCLTSPVTNFVLLIISLTFYAILFLVGRPNDINEVIYLALLFYITYITFVFLSFKGRML